MNELDQKQLLEAWDRGLAMRSTFDRRTNYLDGRHDILDKSGTRRDGKNYNKVVMNWIERLVSRHTGFMTGRSFNVSVPDDADPANAEALEEYDALRETNDLDALDTELFADALVYGYGVEIHRYDGERLIIERQHPAQWVFLLDPDDNEMGAIRRLVLPVGTILDDEVIDKEVVLWWQYTDTEIIEYREERSAGVPASAAIGLLGPLANPSASSAALQETSRTRHAYGMLPVFRWSISKDYSPFVSDALIGLQDAYNKAVSEHLDDVDTDIDAVLAINGAAPGELSRRDPESGKTMLENLREMGAIVFPDGDTRAEFLTRNLPIDKIEYTVRLLRRLIHTAGAAPDLDEMVGATGQTSGIALQLQFQSMLEEAMKWSKYIKPSFQLRLDRLNRIWGVLGLPTLEDYDLKVTYSIPVNETEIWQNIGQLEPLLSRLDRARLVPAIEDPDAAIAAKEAEETTATGGAAPASVLATRAGELAQTAGNAENVIDTATREMQDGLAATLAAQQLTVPPDQMAEIISEFRRRVG